MAYEKYSVTQYSISNILNFINMGTIAIPEIQRPFVWKATNVRDLIDSLYNGYPTGYLIIWQNPDVKLKNGGTSAGKQVLIDGQQRVTALMTAIAGLPVLNDNYESKTIKIAFNPQATGEDDRFAVSTPAHEKSKHWIPDISELFKPGFSTWQYIPRYLERNPEADQNQVGTAIEQLLSINNCQLGVIVLVPQIDISEVTEIFVRINSQGKRLNEADFAMSKIASDEKYGGNMLRKAIDYFCHLAVDPSFYAQLKQKDAEFMASIYAPKLQWLKNDNDNIYDPDYGDMLRVSFMHKFGRGRLGDLVSLLSGRDFKTRDFKDEIVQESFETLKSGVLNFMNEYHFTNFVLAIKSAGFISSKLITSQMTLNFAYTLYLLLNESNEISKNEIKRYIQKWYVLSILTGRYVSSPESVMDRDMRSIAENGFVKYFKDVEEAQLSETFWNVGLVQSLSTSSISSPYFCAFVAAQIHGSDRSLFSSSAKVADLVGVTGDVHHIFPKEYLKQSGITEKSKYNQVANYVYLDTGVNISIGKKSPTDYFSQARYQCQTGEIKIGTILHENELMENLSVNCIPANIFAMTAENYEEFLTERRKQMALKIKNYYFSL